MIGPGSSLGLQAAHVDVLLVVLRVMLDLIQLVDVGQEMRRSCWAYCGIDPKWYGSIGYVTDHLIEGEHSGDNEESYVERLSS